jgi:hypothetical protein
VSNRPADSNVGQPYSFHYLTAPACRFQTPSDLQAARRGPLLLLAACLTSPWRLLLSKGLLVDAPIVPITRPASTHVRYEPVQATVEDCVGPRMKPETKSPALAGFLMRPRGLEPPPGKTGQGPQPCQACDRIVHMFRMQGTFSGLNRIIEQRTGYFSDIGRNMLVDVLSHLGTLAERTDLSADQEASQLSKIEEHIRRALIEHPGGGRPKSHRGRSQPLGSISPRSVPI